MQPRGAHCPVPPVQLIRGTPVRGGRGHYASRCDQSRKDLALGPLGGASNSAMTRLAPPPPADRNHYSVCTRNPVLKLGNGYTPTTYAQCRMKRRIGESSMYVLANTRAYLCATQALP
jgi:hypothetical protein